MSLIFIISVVIIFLLVLGFYKNNWLKNKTIAILPGIFKLIGIIILVCCAIVPVIFKINEIPSLSELRNLFIIIGLIIICLSKEKDESRQYNDKRFIALFISLITMGLIYQIFMIFNFLDVRELSAAQFPISVLISYLLVFHWYKNKFRS